MKITVFCSSEKGTRGEYAEAAREVGLFIGRDGHTLVFGGSKSGLMGVVCDAVLESGGKVVGVLPDVRFIRESAHPKLDEAVYTDSMSERKRVLMETGDAFIVLPGGIGTLDELGETMESVHLGKFRKKVALYNVNGFYDPLVKLAESMLSERFVKRETLELLMVSRSIEEIADFITGGEG